MKKILAVLLAAAMLLCLVPAAFAADEDEVAAADTLHTLGLFNGIGDDADGNPIYDLDREPTRNEAVTMLVRLLGKEAEAKAVEWETPFTDLDEWVKPYVGYAYANKLTYGTSATTFGGSELVSATQYLTFVLRALGYDSSKDFAWNEAWKLSDELGMTGGEYGTGVHFDRGDVVKISCAAMDQPLAAGEETLIESLVGSGAVSAFAAESAGFDVPVPQNGDIVYVKGEYVLYGASYPEGFWRVSCSELRKCFPDAVVSRTGRCFEVHEKWGITLLDQALYNAVFDLHNNHIMSKANLIENETAPFRMNKNAMMFVFNGNGNPLAWFDPDSSDAEGTLAFRVYREDCSAMWEQINAFVDEAVDRCMSNEVYLDESDVLNEWTDKNGNTFETHPVYLNGRKLSSLSAKYRIVGWYFYDNYAEEMQDSEKAFRAIMRGWIFESMWVKELLIYRGLEDGWTYIGDYEWPEHFWNTYYTHDTTDPSLHYVEMLVDESGDVIGYFTINFNVPFSLE